MSGQLLIGMYIGGLLSSVALHWLYQRSAAKDEKRWRAAIKRLRAEVASLRLTKDEREVLRLVSDQCKKRHWSDWSMVIDGILARLGGNA